MRVPMQITIYKYRRPVVYVPRIPPGVGVDVVNWNNNVI